ncbi:hypothetical protein LX36DRAFT_340600 [Colletotrichum falcatum]|nr:hypothetical protein LX36DRAFT_340600 [Colletotrichum falcatum]
MRRQCTMMTVNSHLTAGRADLRARPRSPNFERPPQIWNLAVCSRSTTTMGVYPGKSGHASGRQAISPCRAQIHVESGREGHVRLSNAAMRWAGSFHGSRDNILIPRRAWCNCTTRLFTRTPYISRAYEIVMVGKVGKAALHTTQYHTHLGSSVTSLR